MLKFEPAEVLEVYTDTFDESKIGAVKARLDINEQGQKFKNARTYYPLDPNILQVPVKGEHVLCCEFGGEYYYISKLNRRKSAPENSNFGASAFRRLAEGIVFSFGKYFNPPSRVKKLFIREGDTIIQGRFGNSIRLGSNQHQSGSFDKRNLTESPNVKIVAGAFTNGSVYSESLVSDISSEIVQEEKSSVYLTTDEYVPYEDVGVKSTFDNNETYFKPQVIIQSDRIVFNSKGDDGGIGIYSRDNVEIKSADKVEIDSPTIDIGSNSLVPTVLGNKDFTFLINSLIDGKISSNESGIVEESASPAPNAIKIAELTKENVELNKIKSGKTYLSKKINVE